KAAHQAVINRIREYDPKTGKVCYTRFFNTDFSVFDIDEESPLAPMRYTHKTPSKYTNSLGRQVYDVSDSVNILSVKIASSDVGFPLKVYGTVIARDYLDFKCVYLFRRRREDYQLINSEVVQLFFEDHILTTSHFSLCGDGRFFPLTSQFFYISALEINYRVLEIVWLTHQIIGCNLLVFIKIRKYC
uniref:DUF6598 domain-containing protein n=1 Tax=Aegilops tauschii subsp. strangulata TaxID=200361 RepID=A0A452Y166_AEGTS